MYVQLCCSTMFLWRAPVFNILQQSVVLFWSTWTKTGTGIWYPFTWFSSSWKVIPLLSFLLILWGLIVAKLSLSDWDRKTWYCEKRIPCLLHWVTGRLLCRSLLFRILVPEVRTSWAVQSYDQTVQWSLAIVVVVIVIMWFQATHFCCQNLLCL